MNATRTTHTGKSEAGANPSIDEQRIRELAYQIWETEGCPNGQCDRHWDMARKLAEIETREEPKPAARAPHQQAGSSA